MTKNEMRELDEWIAEHVMGATKRTPKPYRAGVPVFAFWEGGLDCLVSVWSPTTGAGCALAVLERCAQELARKNHAVSVGKTRDGWRVCDIGTDQFYHADSDTLPLAIALFSKELFSK